MFVKLARSLWLFLLILNNCKSLDERAALSGPDLAGSKAGAAASPNCANATKTCGNESAPSLCEIHTYAGKILEQDAKVIAWGKNPCEATNAVTVLACNGGYDQGQLGEVSCFPANTENECPLQSDDCSDDAKASVCTASTYDGQPLPWDLQVKGWGKSPCDAKRAMQLAACRENMQPSKLTEVACADDTSSGQCPSKSEACPADSYKPVTCKVNTYNGQPLDPQFLVFGDDECRARNELKRQACQKNLLPSGMGSAVCESAVKM